MADPAFQNQENVSSEEYFDVYATINNSSDDCSFLVAAFYELDKSGILSKTEQQKKQVKADKLNYLTIDSSGKINDGKEPDEEVKASKEEKKDSKIVTSKSGLDNIIKCAYNLQSCLKSKGTTKVSLNMELTMKEAQFVAQTFYKAYHEEICSLQINQETLTVLKQNHDMKQIDIPKTFPSLFKKNEAAVQRAAPQPGQGPLIKLSVDQLQMTICKRTPGGSIKIDSTSKKLIHHKKYIIDNTSRKLVRTGNSSSMIINDLKDLIREMLFEDYNYELNPDSTIFKEIRSLIKEQLEKIVQLSEGKLKIDNEDELNLLYGTMELVSGVFKIVQPGSEVKINLNQKECIATVVDGGYYSGKLDISVVVEGESSITKLTRDQAKEAGLFEPFNRIEWRQEMLPKPALVNQAIVGCFKWIKEGKEDHGKGRTESMRLLLLMLLKISLLYKSEDNDINELNTIEPLLNICDDYHSKAVEVPTDDYDLQLCEAWKRIVDKMEPVLNYHYTLKSAVKSSSQSDNIQIDSNDVVLTEYAQPSSGYDQLPRPKLQASESKVAVRLLAYWEKTIIPKIIDFVKSTYKPWEMELYFEQLRSHLRRGDQYAALQDALVMCEKKMPAGAHVPDEKYDWSARMPEECIVGSWFLVKIPELKSLFGVENIVVMLKAIDLENKVGLVEHIDKSSMRYNIWVPLNTLYDLPMPLGNPPVCCPLESLKEAYEAKLMTANAYCAKKIIINHFTKKGSIGKVLSGPTDKLTRVKDIISWIIGNEYSKEPISGVKNVYTSIHDEGSIDLLENKSKQKLTSADISELTNLCSKKLAIQEAKNFLNNTNERIIEHELEKTIKEGNTEIVNHLYEWVQDLWKELSDNIQKQKVDIDICKAYQKYAGITDAPSVTPEGQEIIECRDSSILMPLHKLFPKDAIERLNVGMVVSFDKHTRFQCSTATLKFYSDERGANLIAEINRESNQGTLIRPLLFNHGKVWCIFDSGTSAILPKHMQADVTTSLKCSITLVPYEWTTC